MENTNVSQTFVFEITNHILDLSCIPHGCLATASGNLRAPLIANRLSSCCESPVVFDPPGPPSLSQSDHSHPAAVDHCRFAAILAQSCASGRPRDRLQSEKARET